MTIKTQPATSSPLPAQAQTKLPRSLKITAPPVPDRFMNALPRGHRFEAADVERQQALLAKLQQARRAVPTSDDSSED